MITAFLFFTTLIIGMPIVFVLIFGTVVSIYELNMDALIPILPEQLFRSFEKSGFLAIPMFMLVGELMNSGGITRRLMNLADTFVGRFYGGLAYVNLLTNTLASAILGSATAQISMMCRVMVKPMTDRGYDKAYSTGLTVASGMLGPIIPPSMVMIIYAIIAYQSAAALFMAGIFTGLIVALGFCITIYILGFSYEYPPPQPNQNGDLKIGSVLLQGVLPLSIPFVVIVGVVSGVMTPTESGAAGSVLAFIYGWAVFKEIKIRQIPEILGKVGLNGAMVISLIGAASVFGWALGFANVPDRIAQFMAEVSSSPWVFLLLVNIMIIILGMFVDTLGVMVITVPILLPIAQSYGIDPIHFGVIVSICGLLGLVSPPVGTGLFIAMDATGLTMTQLFKAIRPFIISMVISIVIINAFPFLSTWLPKAMNLY